MKFSEQSALGWNRTIRLAVTAIAMAMLFSPPAFAQDTIQADIDALIRASKARAAIVARVKGAVVHISVEKTVEGKARQNRPDLFNDEFFRRFFQPRIPIPPREYKQRGMGSGVIVSEDGLILTNNHVVGEADKIVVKLPDGREFDGELVGTDPGSDIALIRIDGDDLPTVPLGDSDELQIGESVIAIGNPFGLEQTITAGIVSAKGRSGVGVSDYEDFIQTDASINPGNSGGPLINLKGEVVGINTAIFSRSGGNLGIGFAIPINMTKSIMESLIASGKVIRGFLGVVIQDVNQDLADALGVEVNAGVLIANVGPGTPAEDAGILRGDLIVSINGNPVHSSNALRNAVAAMKPGTVVPVIALRDGDEVGLEVIIGEKPDDMSTAFQKDQSQEFLGMGLEPLSPSAAKQFGYEGLAGLLVTSVDRNSPAGESGMRDGTLITEANRKPVQSLKAFQDAVAGVGRGKNLLLLVRFGEMSRFLVIKVP